MSSAKWQQFYLGLNVLAPNRGHAIIWTCDDFTDTCVSPFACDQSGRAHKCFWNVPALILMPSAEYIRQ